jgi:hypothetical protein
MPKPRTARPEILAPREDPVPRIVPIGLDELIGSVVCVGDGRGFIFAAGDKRYVITAAHCLRSPPPPFAWYFGEGTYPRLIGPRAAEPSIGAECLFADPIADLAVLGPPDDCDERDRYEVFLSALPPFDTAAPPPRSRVRVPGPYQTANFPQEGEVCFSAHLMSLDGQWIGCDVRRRGGPLMIEPKELVKGGMSGSPLISATGAALGVVSSSSSNGAWASVLADGLPGWLLRALACAL